MSLRKIITKGNPVLKKKAKAVKKITKDHLTLIDDMFDTMIAAPGIGLAAPQIGVSERIIVIGLEENRLCLINPKIVKKSGKQVFREACLSVPGLDAPVERYEKVCVKALDRAGKPLTINADELFAVVLQHEIDHLDGILFVDRVTDPSLIEFKKTAKEETI